MYRVPVLALAASAALGCDPIPATQVLVRFTAEPELRSQAARLHVQVWSQEGALVLDREKTLTGSEDELARVPVVPRDEDASRFFSVRAELFDASGGSLGVERVVSGYIKDELAELLLVFEAACSKVSDCGEGRRCHGGVCAGACVNPVTGHAERESRPRCQSCQRCVANRCEALEDGAACGCDGDHCEGGNCVIARPVRSVALGVRHSCALPVNGAAYCWGSNENGRTGTGQGAETITQPASVLELTTFWRGIYSEGDATCVLGGDEIRHCWGGNWFGEYGDGTIGQGSPTPVRIDTPTFRELAAGGGHFCGLKADGTLWCWGYNARAQLGRGFASENEPAAAELGLQDVRLIDAGGLHSCAVGENDQLWCWGYNDSGQIGVGDLVDRSTPVRPGCEPTQSGACFQDWQVVSLGSFHSCGVRKNGSLWCWGGNGNAQLGVGSAGTNERGPLRVGDRMDWVTVAAGHQHTCAIRSDGTLWCWGNGERGQLGNGSLERSTLPSRVASFPDGRWEQIATAGGGGPGGGAHTCAIQNDRTLWCWGRNLEGQIGIGVANDEPVMTPRRVCLPRP